MMNFNSVITYDKGLAKKILRSLDKSDLLIYSPTTVRRAGLSAIIRSRPFCLNVNDISLDKSTIEKLALKGDTKRIVSFGGGKTTDIAKYLAYYNRLKLISIPSILSTNASFTDKSCLLFNGEKKTFCSKVPDEVIVDVTILNKTPHKFHLFGLCDVLSIHTALRDWEIFLKHRRGKSHFQTDPITFCLARTILDILENNIEEVTRNNDESLLLISKLIMLSGYVTILHGSGRPESGSEHIFAKVLERKTETYHAIAVCFGIIAMSALQKNGYRKIVKLIKRLGILKYAKNRGITKEIIKNTLLEVNPDGNRYTILDEIKIDEKCAIQLTNRILLDI
jgi:glycerol-1-phosphate dehydrogenase [NAD(P)+]